MQAPLDPGGGEAAGSQKRCFGLCENGVDFGSMVWLWGKRWHISPSDVGTLHENIVAWMPLPAPYQKEEKR